MKKSLLWLLIMLLTVSIVVTFSLAGCKKEEVAEEEVAEEEAVEEEVAEEEAVEEAETTALPKDDWVIGLSNSYYGNVWRHQMVESFESAAQMAKDQGLIKDFEVQNGDNTVPAQIAQLNSFILKEVDAICINAASPTALNDVIEKAVEEGIVVVAFDSVVTSPAAYIMDYDWELWGKAMVDYVAERLNGQGDIILLRGPSGSAPDIGVNEGEMRELEKYPDLNVVAVVSGEASDVKAQEELLKILPSLPNVDAVLTMAAATGTVNAFEQLNREIPIIIGDNTAEFINWWIEKKKTTGYETLSICSTPGCGSAAFWVALNILKKVDVPEKMILELLTVTQDEVEQYADLKAGTFVSPVFTNDYVVKHYIEPAMQK